MRLNYLITRQSRHNYERAAHEAERGVTATNDREGRKDRRDGREPVGEEARPVGGVIE